MTDNRLPPGYVPLTAHTLNGSSGRGEGRSRSDNNGNGDSRRSDRSRRGSDSYRSASSSRDRKGPGGRPQSGGRKRQRPQRSRGGSSYRRERDDDFQGDGAEDEDMEIADEE